MNSKYTISWSDICGTVSTLGTRSGRFVSTSISLTGWFVDNLLKTKICNKVHRALVESGVGLPCFDGHSLSEISPGLGSSCHLQPGSEHCIWL